MDPTSTAQGFQACLIAIWNQHVDQEWLSGRFHARLTATRCLELCRTPPRCSVEDRLLPESIPHWPAPVSDTSVYVSPGSYASCRRSSDGPGDAFQLRDDSRKIVAFEEQAVDSNDPEMVPQHLLFLLVPAALR